MLLRVHTKSFFLSFPLFFLVVVYLKRTAAMLYDCTEKRSSKVAIFRAFRCCRAVVAFFYFLPPMSCIFFDWSKKTSYQEIKIKNSKIAYTKLSSRWDEKQKKRRKHEIGRFFSLYSLSTFLHVWHK